MPTVNGKRFRRRTQAGEKVAVSFDVDNTLVALTDDEIQRLPE